MTTLLQGLVKTALWIQKVTGRSHGRDQPSGITHGCTDMVHCFGRVLAFSATMTRAGITQSSVD